MDRETPLKSKVSDLDRQLFKARNEALILKREMESAKKSTTGTAEAAGGPHPVDVHLYKELEALKNEREQVRTSWGRCYDHNFLRFAPNCRRTKWRFSQKMFVTITF
jgi:hypothetical protein